MGNSYSVAQEEQEEAEFERLVRAVERAQRGETSVPHDLEAQYGDAEPHAQKPPPSEKVMMWFKGRQGNRVSEPKAYRESPSASCSVHGHSIQAPPVAGKYSQTRSSAYNLKKLTNT